MKEKVSKVSLIIYAVLLILSGFLMSAPGDRVGWFCIMGIFAIPPIVAGLKRYQVLGIIALLIAIAAVVTDYHAGKLMQERLEENLKQHKEEADTLRADGVEGIIFSSSKADFVTHVTGRKDLESWTPCESDIAEAIPAIKFFLAKKAPSIASRLTEYRCQYFGIVVDGKKRIYCNFFHREGHEENWKSNPLFVLDGGDWYFQLEYEIESGQCLNLQINGEA